LPSLLPRWDRKSCACRCFILAVWLLPLWEPIVDFQNGTRVSRVVITVSLRRLRPAPFRFWLPRAGPLRKAASGLGSRAHSLSDPTRPPNAADSPPANHAASRPNCMRSAHPRTPMISPLIDSCGAASHNGIASVTGFGMINAAGLFARQLLSAENAVSKAAVLDRSETYGADSGADRMGVRFGGNSEVPCRRPGNGPFYEGQHNSSRLHGSLHRCCRDCFLGHRSWWAS